MRIRSGNDERECMANIKIGVDAGVRPMCGDLICCLRAEKTSLYESVAFGKGWIGGWIWPGLAQYEKGQGNPLNRKGFRMKREKTFDFRECSV